jgi:uncharacterized protein (TIGR00255 family)
MLSMTGYGRGHASLGRGSFVVEIRAVNHRFLDLRARVDAELAAETHVLEAYVRKHVLRGRVDLSARLEGKLGTDVVLDRGRARAAFAELIALRDELAPNEPVPLSLLSGVPALFSEIGAPPADARLAAAEHAVQMACEDLAHMRTVEGAALAADLTARAASLLGHVDQIAGATVNQAAMLRDKLSARVRKLLEQTSDMPLDAGRLELEVALLADRTDVSEELTRMRSHVAQLRELLADTGPDPVGRKLEFLIQELSREANTAGAKIADAAAAYHVLEVKAELERMREQVQNVL